MRNTRLQLLAVFCLGLPTAGLAQEAGTEEPEMVDRIWDLGVGIGFGDQSNPFVGADDVSTYVTLDLAIYGERFFFDNGELGFTWIDQPGFGLNVLTTYSSDRVYYSYFNDLALVRTSSVQGGPLDSLEVLPVDVVGEGGTDPAPPGVFSLLNLPDRSFAVNLGLEAVWDMPNGQVQWQVLQDVSNTHQGTQMDVGFSHTWAKGKWAFQPRVGVSWKSAQLVDYYYGLDNQSSLFRLRYEGADAININMGFLLSYRISNKLSYVNQFSYTQLDQEIHQSPLIDTDHTRSFFSGLYYRF
ncbi:MipA/OmpV family protein [Marinicella meishanensis]|uniref:MipA/OmpV family protein n=1 Tax=Marinicella meishanensis TaxID=2873263 RepID=UPI001CC1237C|nr:MipA/OmpV family protein [Marinicella sp. NBU2979]